MKKVKDAIRGMTRRAGFEIVRRHAPEIAVSDVVSGSFAPYDSLFAVGRSENYFIQDGYRVRTEQVHFDDTPNSDEWQDEVYQFAREVADREHLRTVCDIGCGSGFKLMKYFRDHVTIGFEVEETLRTLRAKYPNRKWLISDFKTLPPERPDLTICSDVIEHVLKPDSLMEYLQSVGSRFLVLSTPDRSLIRLGTHFGPPHCQAHIREWTMPEFHAFVSQYFKIIDHFISCPKQAKQCLLAVPLPNSTA